jgi:hypothetical protein
MGEEPAWSESVKGIRGRLQVLPPKDEFGGHGSPFFRIYLELQNTADTMGQINIRHPARVSVTSVHGEDGQALARPSGGMLYDGMSPNWKALFLPMDGTVHYRISFPGVGHRPGSKVGIIDLGLGSVWEIPMDGKTYYLDATFINPAEPGDHPFMDWSGTLKLPPAPIPVLK